MSPWKAETPAHANLLIRRYCIFNQQLPGNKTDEICSHFYSVSFTGKTQENII
jgi:hypothetical protein